MHSSFVALFARVLTLVLLCLCVMSLAVPVAQAAPLEQWGSGPVLYVSPTGSDGNSGDYWQAPLRTLQAALQRAQSYGNNVEIRVAAGTYTPGNDRESFFFLRGKVRLYGGYIPGSNFSQRDWHAFPTILSGEIGAAGNADNSYRVLRSEESSRPILDGFIVTGGNAEKSKGAGMLILQNSAPFIYNTIFRNNVASAGGGIFSYPNSRPFLLNTIFVNNRALSKGGAIYNHGGNIAIASSIFYANEAEGVGQGGGIYSTIKSGSSLNVVNSIFWQNDNGAISYRGVVPSVSHSVVQGGYAGTGNLNSDPLFIDADGADNTIGTNDDNFSLSISPRSPAIDAGNNQVLLPRFDFALQQRVVDGDGNGSAQVDIGALNRLRRFSLSKRMPLVATMVLRGRMPISRCKVR